MSETVMKKKLVKIFEKKIYYIIYKYSYIDDEEKKMKYFVLLVDRYIYIIYIYIQRGYRGILSMPHNF